MTTQIETVEHLTGKAVRDVFQKMLSMDVSQEPPVSLSKEEAAQIIGSVGFAGEATGIICLYVSLNLATVLTSRMLGITEAEVDSNEMVNDAIGELTNMIVGFVKSNLSDSNVPCVLSIPSIVRGQCLSMEGSSQVNRKLLGFSCGPRHVTIEIFLKEPKAKPQYQARV